LEREDTKKVSQGGSQHTTIMVESSIVKRVAKWPWKEEIEAKEKYI
jgi:hypothetical protein